MAMNNNGGKGSAVRPLSVTRDEYANKFDAIFGKKKTPDGHTYGVEVNVALVDNPTVTEDGLVKKDQL